MKRMVLDWRGAPTLTTPADLYSVASTLESRPATGNPQGRILAAISATILYGPDGKPSTRPFNADLAAAMQALGATTTREVWKGDNGYSQRIFDLTKRGALKAWLDQIERHLSWADGLHVDWFSAWSWLFPDLAESDQKWDDLLASLATELRAKGKLVLGQQFHTTNPLAACDGAFVEQSPYAFRYTLAEHEKDMQFWRAITTFADKKPRESIWTYEIRDWQNWPQASLDYVKAWAEDQGVHLCLGRDGNATV